MRRIGAHISSAGGLALAIDRAQLMGANCVQLFSGSPRVWQKRPLADISVDKMLAKRQNYNIEPIFTHALYLVNLTATNQNVLKKSLTSLRYELEFDSHIQGSGVIVHAGSHLGMGWDQVKNDLVKRIDQLLATTPENSTLLIENSAGQNGKLHSNLTEIKWTFDQLPTYIKTKRLGWCFDTCHAFAAGYTLAKAVEEISQLKLWSTLKCIHVNDSRDAFDSHRDRHGNIGDGLIPPADLKKFLNHQLVKNIPLITEVPGLDGNGPDKANLDRIKKLVK